MAALGRDAAGEAISSELDVIGAATFSPRLRRGLLAFASDLLEGRPSPQGLTIGGCGLNPPPTEHAHILSLQPCILQSQSCSLSGSASRG